MQEVQELFVGAAVKAFGDVGDDRDGASSHLSAQVPISL